MEDIQRLNYKIKRIRRYKAIGKVLFYAVMLIISTAILVKIDSVEVMQTDTLNTVMDIEKTIDLSEESEAVNQVDQNEEKAGTRGAEKRTTLSQGEREYIERVCMAECRGGGVVGMAAVAQCISDRAHLWNMDPMEVVTQDSQFADPYQGEISAEAVQAVWAVFDEGMRIFEDNNVTHFYKEGTAEPYWTNDKTYVKTVEGNLYYESNY